MNMDLGSVLVLLRTETSEKVTLSNSFLVIEQQVPSPFRDTEKG